ncbi:hypothetical protein [Fimbriimonas ginsengisoli]|uniref:J domain-containing protein n=1 Tax=Fimbriimonas ginsengisoli Gsoil 348 TaxID=661478 RepID=A0A068NM52_FIMGI|nr:hypothetical protein [Fimbriimonas ginsengisoli]AIE83865.1 hypothetical protein OP10G_0497 [Fimbriimonas ginsengisoli Gsoil 348]
MSTGKRAYDVLRGYVNREWERIHGVELSDAERELSDALDAPAPRPAANAASPASGSTFPPATVSDTDWACQVMGVGTEATFADIRKSFDRIIKRTDPANFPEGSAEAKQAEEIHRRVHRAYAILTEGMDATEKRFRSLEID